MDKIIEKEWNKIKDYNILNSIEDLEKLFKKIRMVGVLENLPVIRGAKIISFLVRMMN